MSLFLAAGRQSLMSLVAPRLAGATATRSLSTTMARRTLITSPRRRTARHLKASASTVVKDAPHHKTAMDMPTSVREMDNSTLITLAAMDDHEACSEMLIRHIMTVERSSYTTALRRFHEVDTYHKEGMGVLLMPYKIGITTALSAAGLSVPLVFHLPMVQWFNEHFVTTDIPEPRDLETWLEVGSWSWAWMEPLLGHISFFLLCLQFSRAQLENLGLRPYTRYIKQYRVTRLQAMYPQYDARTLACFSKTAKLYQ